MGPRPEWGKHVVRACSLEPAVIPHSREKGPLVFLVARTCSLEPALIQHSREKGPRLFLRGRTAGSKNHLLEMARGWRRLRFVESAISRRDLSDDEPEVRGGP